MCCAGHRTRKEPRRNGEKKSGNRIENIFRKNMKRILYFTLILAICSACTYRLDIEEPEEITLKFNASLPASFSEVENYDGTKADLKVGERVPKWHPDDFIKVFLPKDGGVEELKSLPLKEKDIDPTTGEATFTVNFKGVGTSTAGKIGPFFAEYGLPDTTKLEIFPQEETKGTAKFIMNIPAKQTYSPEYVYKANECPMLAYAESNTTGAFNLRFQNVYGILKVSFTENSIITDEKGSETGETEGTGKKEIKAVELVECGIGTNDYISGKFDVTFGEGQYSDTDKTIGPLLEKKAKYGGDSKNKFIVRNTLGDTGNDYYFLLPAGSLASGFKLNILHKDGTYTTMTQGARTSGGLKRDVITKYTVTGTTIITPEDAPLKTANCYVFPATNGVYSIPATNKGNGAQGNDESSQSQEKDVEHGQERLYTTNSYPLSYSENYVAEVLWQTKNDDCAVTEGEIITLQGYTKNDKDATGEIRFNLTGIKGNAVIALKDGPDGKILWSWHIWVIDHNDLTYVESDKYYDLTGNITLNNNAGIIMNKNLGAYSTSTNDVHAYGLMYQFGRKDPFPGARAASISGGSDKVVSEIFPLDGIKTQDLFESFTESINNPTTFAISNDHTWISCMSRNLGWMPNCKNLFDPCPIGWRVCGYEPLINASGTEELQNRASLVNNGMNFSEISSDDFWIPFTGWINDGGWKAGENSLHFTSIGNVGGYYYSKLVSGKGNEITQVDRMQLKENTMGEPSVLYTHMSGTDLITSVGDYGHGYPVRCIKWNEPEIPKPTTTNTGN